MDSNTDDLPSTLITIIIAGVILFIGLTAVSATIDVGDSDGTADRVETAAPLEGTQFSTLADSWGDNEDVYDSRGYAVELTGANDSFVRSEEDIAINPADNWTVSLWASYDSTSDEMTALSLDGRIEVRYNGTSDEWLAWYYDDGDRASYEVSVSSSANATELEHVVVTRNSSELTIYANQTQGSTATLSGSSSVSAPVNRTNWDGRLEELRVDEEAWDSSLITSHYNDPIAPLATNHTARVMFDEPYRGTQRMFYNAGDVVTSNATFVDGLPGQELDSGGVLATSEYDWDNDGPRIRAEGGERLDGAPVAYVDYDQKDALGGLRDGFESAVGLAGLLLVILPVGTIFVYMYGIRDER